MPKRTTAQRVAGAARRFLMQRIWTPTADSFRLLRNRERSYRPVFIAGAMGSGTSLLAQLMGQRFDCAALLPESARHIRSSSFLWAPPTEILKRIRDYEAAIEPQPTWDPEAGRRELGNLHRSCASGPSDVVIDKSPNTHQLRANYLLRCFPDGRFVLIFRDPVVNIEGFRRKWPMFGADSLEENIRFYRTIHERFLDQLESVADSFMAVEYEALVDDPEPVLDRIGRFASLQPAQRARKLDDRPNTPGRGVRNVRDNRIEIIRDTSSASYETLDEAAVQRIQTSLHGLHERLRELARRGP